MTLLGEKKKSTVLESESDVSCRKFAKNIHNVCPEVAKWIETLNFLYNIIKHVFNMINYATVDSKNWSSLRCPISAKQCAGTCIIRLLNLLPTLIRT